MKSAPATRLRSEKVPSGSVPAPRLTASTPAPASSWGRLSSPARVSAPQSGSVTSGSPIRTTKCSSRSSLPDREVDPAQQHPKGAGAEAQGTATNSAGRWCRSQPGSGSRSGYANSSALDLDLVRVTVSTADHESDLKQTT